MKTQEDQRYEEWQKYEQQQEQEKLENRHYGEYWEDIPSYSHDAAVNTGLNKFYSDLIQARTKKSISEQIDNLEMQVTLGSTFSDLFNLFDIEPQDQESRIEWLEFVAGQARKYVLETALKNKERLENERQQRKKEKNSTMANSNKQGD